MFTDVCTAFCNGGFQVKKLYFSYNSSMLSEFPSFKYDFVTLKGKYVVFKNKLPDYFWVFTHHQKNPSICLGPVDLYCKAAKQFINIYPHIGHPDITLFKDVDLNTLPCINKYSDIITEVVSKDILYSYDIPAKLKQDLSIMPAKKIQTVPKDLIFFLTNLKTK
jgi:hypothetical protein